jgi:hypothetical protein
VFALQKVLQASAMAPAQAESAARGWRGLAGRLGFKRTGLA